MPRRTEEGSRAILFSLPEVSEWTVGRSTLRTNASALKDSENPSYFEKRGQTTGQETVAASWPQDSFQSLVSTFHSYPGTVNPPSCIFFL